MVDVFDIETLIVKEEFIECVRREYNIVLSYRRFGEYYSVSFRDLPPQLQEELRSYVLSKTISISKEVTRLRERLLRRPATPELVLRVRWEMDALYPGPKRVTSIYLPQSLIKDLDNIAKMLGMRRNELVYRVLASFAHSFRETLAKRVYREVNHEDSSETPV